MADKNGIVTILWYSEKDKRYRVVTGYVGEDGIKAGVKYKADAKGKMVTA